MRYNLVCSSEVDLDHFYPSVLRKLSSLAYVSQGTRLCCDDSNRLRFHIPLFPFNSYTVFIAFPVEVGRDEGPFIGCDTLLQLPQ